MLENRDCGLTLLPAHSHTHRQREGGKSDEEGGNEARLVRVPAADVVCKRL
jgi:hypothetical protein